MPYNITFSIPQSSTLRSFSNFKKETLGLDTELTAVFHYKKTIHKYVTIAKHILFYG